LLRFDRAAQRNGQTDGRTLRKSKASKFIAYYWINCFIFGAEPNLAGNKLTTQKFINSNTALEYTAI